MGKAEAVNPLGQDGGVSAEIFGVKYTAGQLCIIGAVLDPEVKRLIISAVTQYGKTRATATAVLLYILSSRGKKVIFIAPTIRQTSIIRNYVAETIALNPVLSEQLSTVSNRGSPDQLHAEASRERITFHNGCEIITLTAHGGGSDPGAQLMGYGGDLIVLDEACLISDDVYRMRITRMLGANPDAKLVVLLNPWHKHNFAYRAWCNENFRRIHIGWEQAVAEGRVSREFIEEQRAELTPTEFRVLYESDFPDDNVDALIRWDWLVNAVSRELNVVNGCHVWGLDVAEQGVDFTVLTEAVSDGEYLKVLRQIRINERDTMPIADRVHSIVPVTDYLHVDSIGVGAGVFSRLRQLGHNVFSIRVSEKPTVTPERFFNLKAQRFWMLRQLFEDGKIEIPDDSKLKLQLSGLRYEIVNGKIRIIDPPGKSPDYADSLMLTLRCVGKRRLKYSGLVF